MSLPWLHRLPLLGSVFAKLPKSSPMVCCLLAALMATGASAGDLPPRPQPPSLVNDMAGILTDSEQARLERKLRSYEDKTSTEIAIVTVDSLEGRDISSYAVRLAQAWGVGKSDKDNGVMIVIAEKERKTFIATGYGVEARLTDALSKRIVETVMVPKFKQDNYYAGLDGAVDAIQKALAGEFQASASDSSSGPSLAPFVLALFLFVLFPALVNVRSVGRSHLYGHRSRVGGAGALATGLLAGTLLGSLGGGRSFRDFSGGTGSFGGFGGGGFGGGGAGGSF